MRDDKYHELAHIILHKMGYFVELIRDFHFGFINSEGTDIQDGRLTWLIVLAIQRANPDQRTLLDANYGSGTANQAEIVQQVAGNDLVFFKVYLFLNFLFRFTRN